VHGELGAELQLHHERDEDVLERMEHRHELAKARRPRAQDEPAELRDGRYEQDPRQDPALGDRPPEAPREEATHRGVHRHQAIVSYPLGDPEHRILDTVEGLRPEHRLAQRLGGDERAEDPQGEKSPRPAIERDSGSPAVEDREPDRLGAEVEGRPDQEHLDEGGGHETRGEERRGHPAENEKRRSIGGVGILSARLRTTVEALARGGEVRVVTDDAECERQAERSLLEVEEDDVEGGQRVALDGRCGCTGLGFL